MKIYFLQVIHLLKTYYSKYKNIKKCPKSRNNENKIKEFLAVAVQKLFDISVCKCNDYLKCKCKTKIPISERDFLMDQRKQRNMAIGTVDAKTSKMLEQRIERKQKQAAREKQTIELEMETDTLSEEGPVFEGNVEVYSPDKASTSKTNQMRIHLPNLAVACDRTGVSDRAAAIIVSAVLQDIGVVAPDNQTQIIDRSKLRRERKRTRENLQSTSLPPEPLSIFFDGRKDTTIVQEKRGKHFHRKIIKEEHVVILAEPGSLYMGHLTPKSGSAENIRKCIVTFLKSTNTDLNKLVAIGSDGTVVNTGSKNGVISQLEHFVGRPLHWFVCLLHCNELPLRHLFQELDGKTSGPKQFSGRIGQSLLSCERLKVVGFRAIPVELPAVDLKDLSSDQKYLYEICSAISEGRLATDLENREPGKMAHSRWLTMANRVLRLYVSTESPSESLITLTEFIVKVYAFTWFEIKASPHVKDAPKHLLGMIKRSSYLPEHLQIVVRNVIQRNGFFAHSENILLAMLQDERRRIRELALRRILRAREKKHNFNIRIFEVPKLNFDAEEYFSLINWSDECLSEPPITQNLKDDEIKDMIKTGSIMKIPNFPCHSQAVERHIKLVTDASVSVCGEKARDGFIRSRLKSRCDMPQFETKRNFFSKFDASVPPEDDA